MKTRSLLATAVTTALLASSLVLTGCGSAEGSPDAAFKGCTVYSSRVYFDETKKVWILSIGNDDTIVSISDENQIFSLINSNNKRLLNVTTLHIGMGDNEEVKNYVKTSLDKSIYK